jgi:MFS family permease
MISNLMVRVFVPYALGNVLGAFYRTVMAILAPDLIDELGFGAEDLGLLTSIYFLIFAAAQLPMGVLLDRYGARIVTVTTFAIGGAGCLVFSLSHDIALLALGRALMGLGMSVALMGGFKAMADWLPREKIAFGNGIILMAGGLGSMSATMPVQFALSMTDWRGVIFGLGLVTFAVAIIVLFVAPEKQRDAGSRSIAEAWRGLRQVFVSPAFIANAPLGGITMGISMSVNNLWSGPWLRDVAGVAREDVAQILLGNAAMMTVAVFFTGSIVERLARAGIPILVTACFGITCFIALQCVVIANPAVSPYALWLPMAFFGTTPVLIYTVLTQSFPHALAGRVNTAYNFVVFVVGFGAQWSIGAIIDLWPPVADGRFAPEGYRTALAVMVCFEIAAFVWLLVGNRRAKLSAKSV